MLTFKNIKRFERRIQDAPSWDDYFTVAGRMYKLYEYGDAMGNSYVYFLNKRTHDAILVIYNCPSTDYKKIPAVCEKDGKAHVFKKGTIADGNMNVCIKCLRRSHEEVITKTYRLHAVEIIPRMELWRTDTV